MTNDFRHNSKKNMTAPENKYKSLRQYGLEGIPK